MTTRDSNVDAVVIGAGHNGLTCAAYLARAGLRVNVYERRDVLGGATVTEELAPGYRVSTASYALSLLRPDVATDLELERHGLVAIPKDPQMFVPLPDGGSFFVWRNADRTKEELARLHPGDADNYDRWCAFWEEAVALLRPVFDDPKAVNVERYLHGKGKDSIYQLAVAGSAAETVEHFFEHPAIQGAFASQGIVGTWASVRDPGTAWVMTYHGLGGELYGADGTWGFARGGMGAVSGAIEAAAREAGAAFFKSNPVTSVIVDKGPSGERAVGVRLANGLKVFAPHIISGADPRTTFLGLVPDGALESSFRERVANWTTQGCVVKLNLALRELPDFTARPGRGPQHHGTIEISPSLDYLHEAYTDAQGVGHSQHPWMEVFVQSVLDPTLTDAGGHVVSCFTQYVAPKTFDPQITREHASEAALRTLASYAPNVLDAVVAAEALGPVELEERFALPGGDIFHGSLLPDQSFDQRFDCRTPLPGLYLGGSGARPGGAVTGAAGRNAARAVLEDLGARGSG
jgi:phytoene dehydrogenase-like protein